MEHSSVFSGRSAEGLGEVKGMEGWETGLVVPQLEFGYSVHKPYSHPKTVFSHSDQSGLTETGNLKRCKLFPELLKYLILFIWEGEPTTNCQDGSKHLLCVFFNEDGSHKSRAEEKINKFFADAPQRQKQVLPQYYVFTSDTKPTF